MLTGLPITPKIIYMRKPHSSYNGNIKWCLFAEDFMQLLYQPWMSNFWNIYENKTSSIYAIINFNFLSKSLNLILTKQVVNPPPQKHWITSPVFYQKCSGRSLATEVLGPGESGAFPCNLIFPILPIINCILHCYSFKKPN